MTSQPKKTQRVDSVVRGLATHVVTGILYGTNAFFVFDSEKSDSSNVEEIQGQMEAVVKLIPSFNINGEVKLKLGNKQQKLVDTFSCTFYGDLLLKSNPSTFEEAVVAYTTLPQLLGEKNENAVPLQVWLMPLKNFDYQAAEVKNGISVGTVRKAEEALEDVTEIKARCNDSLQVTTVNSFPQIHKMLSRFHKLCGYYAAAIQLVIAKELPLIRAGEKDEDEIKKQLEDKEKSPFSHEKLSEWMEQKEREINVIRSCLEIMEGIKIVSNQSELDKEVLAPDAEVFCFVFTSVETDDPALKDMADYVDPFKMQNTEEVPQQNSEAESPQVPWYNNNEVITKMRGKAKAFMDLFKTFKDLIKRLMDSGVPHEIIQEIMARNYYLTAAIANPQYKGASIYHYQNGILDSDDYSPLPRSEGGFPFSLPRSRQHQFLHLLCSSPQSSIVPQSDQLKKTANEK